MLSVVIQAGGRSSRMGQDKAFVRLGGRTLIEHVLEIVNPLGDETLITTNDPDRYSRFGQRLVSDPIPGAGALYGLHTALDSAQHSSVLTVACDMPFLQKPLLNFMIQQIGAGDVIVPRPAGRYEPLLAVYRRESCLRAVDRALQSGEQRMISFYPDLDVVEITDPQLDELDPERLSFFNINDSQDLVHAENRIAALTHDPNPTASGGTTNET